jgi:hypothetical protein
MDMMGHANALLGKKYQVRIMMARGKWFMWHWPVVIITGPRSRRSSGALPPMQMQH